jgi:hypothetical protein
LIRVLAGATADFERRFGANCFETIRLKQELGEAYLMVGKVALAKTQLASVCDSLSQLRRDDDIQTAGAYMSLALAMAKLGELDDAETAMLNVIFKQQGIYGDSPDRDMMPLCFYSRVLRDAGRLSEAEQIARYVVGQHQRQFGEDHIASVSSMHTLASIIRKQRRFETEAAWQSRLFLARSRLHGPLSDATMKAGRELVVCVANCVRRHFGRLPMSVGEALHLEARHRKQIADGAPVVRRTNNGYVVEWQHPEPMLATNR